MRIRSLHLVISLVIVLAAMKPAKSSSVPGSATKFPAQVATQESGVDLTRLPIGDNRLANSPKVGWIWPCRVDPNAGGAFKAGPWIKADGTYDFTAKAVVDGAVPWSQHSLEVKLVGDKRVLRPTTCQTTRPGFTRLRRPTMHINMIAIRTGLIHRKCRSSFRLTRRWLHSLPVRRGPLVSC